jgi:hypothetical protein
MPLARIDIVSQLKRRDTSLRRLEAVIIQVQRVISTRFQAQKRFKAPRYLHGACPCEWFVRESLDNATASWS